MHFLLYVHFLPIKTSPFVWPSMEQIPKREMTPEEQRDELRKLKWIAVLTKLSSHQVNKQIKQDDVNNAKKIDEENMKSLMDDAEEIKTGKRKSTKLDEKTDINIDNTKNDGERTGEKKYQDHQHKRPIPRNNKR